MILSRRRLGLTVGLLSIALVGLVVVQGLLLLGAWRQKEQAFERGARAALAQTVQQIEAQEIAGQAGALFFKAARGDTAQAIVRRGTGQFLKRTLQTTAVGGDSLYVVCQTDSAWVAAPDSLVVSHFNAADLSRLEVGEHGSSQFTIILEGDRTQLIEQVVGDLVHLRPRPIARRLAGIPVDSLLTAQLTAAGIALRPDFAVLAAADDAPAAFGPAGPELVASPLRARLFPLDRGGPWFDLVLRFPGRHAFVLRQLAPLLVASLVFLAIVAVGFVRTVGALFEQRRFARQVVDFVNNMTHEFKTPLSTVTLASEAIARGPEPAALQRYNTMIREETGRMGRQVEQILQVARLEGGEVRLNRTPLDGDELVRSVCGAFALQVEGRGGRLECRGEAAGAMIAGDGHHLASVLNNLLDNALKYSPQAPEITVTTAVQGDALVITVGDRGPGVARADHERVFEPYYRCPTGNRHDVKGFGLGLSTVRLLVAAHGGQVALDGNPGGGARVTVRLPLSDRKGTA